MPEQGDVLDELMRADGVTRLGGCPRTVAGLAPAGPPGGRRQPVLGMLARGCCSGSRDDQTWCKPGLDADLRKLRRTDFPPEDLLDLHGETVETAWEKVDQFLGRAASAGLHIVEIVHGNGKCRSIKGVLRGKVRNWLAHCAQVNLYFEPQGNSGAVRVQLRRTNAGRVQGR